MDVDFKTRARRTLFCLWAAAFGWPAALSAQEPFDTWTVRDGLPQSSVNDIRQTRDGYLWLATYGGLVRFDGVRFVVFDRATPGIGSIRILALHEDRAGTLWAGTDDGVLLRYRDGRFTTFDRSAGFYAPNVLRIDEGSDGALWVTSVGRVTRFDGARFEVFRPGDLPEGVRPRDGPTPEDPTAIHNRTAVWWHQDGRGLHCLLDGRVQRCLPAETLEGSKVVAVTTDQAGSLWVHLAGGSVIGRSERGVRRYTVTDGLPDVPRLEQLLEDREGSLWVIHRYAGSLSRVRGGAREVLPASNVLRVYEDREGSIWIGSASRGLLRVRRHVISMLTTADGLSSNNVYPLLRDRLGRVWAGTWGSGVNRIGHDGVAVFRMANGLPSDYITALHEDRAGRLLVGTRRGIADIAGRRVTPYRDPNGWLADHVWAIHEDDDGTRWFATDHGLVWQRGESWGRYTSADGLADDLAFVLLRSRAGPLWIGTQRGLSRLEDGTFTNYTERHGLVGNHVRALAEVDAALWIGTYDGGLYRLADGQLARFTTLDGLHDNGVFQLLDDGQGHFWMGSNRGLSRVKRADLADVADGRTGMLRVDVFGPPDGLTTPEFNGGRQPSGLRMPDGTLWLPTQGGIARVSPSAVRLNPHPPPVRVEAVRVGGRQVADWGGRVDVPTRRGAFEVDYTALSLVKSDQVRFRYRLQGLDDGWVDAGTRRTAAYHGLPHGQYTFQVIAANSDGVWNTEGQVLTVVVPAPVWRQAWFLALLGAAAAAVVVLADRRRIGRLRREHARQQAYASKLLETQEQERRRISNELHDSLGQALLLIRQRARAVAGNGDADHSPAAALTAIDSLAGRAYDEMKDLAYNLRPYHLDKIGLTRTLEGMLRRVSRACGYEIAADLDDIDDLVPADARIGVYRIVQEGVSNIVRHARATEAEVRIRRVARGIEIEIRDNGVGFPPATDGAETGGSGSVGLANLKERARTLNGEVAIESRASHGTTLRVRLAPDQTAHAS